MILYFSGTGNSEYVAKRIGKTADDEVVNLFLRLRDQDYTEIHSKRTWVVVTPTYAWRIPRIVENWIQKTKFTGNRSIYFIMTCGADIGNAGKYLKELCSEKGMRFCGCGEVVMPENYIAMFRTPSQDEAFKIICHSEKVIDKLAMNIKSGEKIPQTRISILDQLTSGIVNQMFYPMFVHAKKFSVDKKCISCGKCVKVCPLQNIRMHHGRPVWGKECTHCMACICRCPAEAIEYGRHSKELPRYTFPKDKISL